MKRLSAAIVAVLVLASCSGAPIQTEKTQNKDFTIDFLFEHDGCRIYRFWDGGYSRYWANCRGGISTTFDNYLVSSGKTSYSVHNSIVTDAR